MYRVNKDLHARGVIEKIVDCLYKFKTPKGTSNNFEHFKAALEQIRIKHTYFLNKLSMCLLAWYDKAAQLQNITFSQRKS